MQNKSKSNNKNFNDFLDGIFKVFNKGKYKTNIVSNPDSKKGSILKSILATIVIMFLAFFFILPSLNPASDDFYRFLISALIIFIIIHSIINKGLNKKVRNRVIASILVLVAIPLAGKFISGVFFRSKSFANLINVQDGEFSSEIKKIKLNNIPVVDRDSAVTIGQKQMGTMTDLVSQFEIDGNYAQININANPVRVSPLGYSDLVKYLYNNKNGIPGFISVDMHTQNAKLNNLKNPIMYSDSDILMRDLKRKLRFQYPFEIFGETNFEVDDNNEAYYVTSLIRKKIGFFNGDDVYGAVLTNANTGESVKYDLKDIPAWVDRVFPAEMIIKQLDQRGLFQGGYINSLFGQKNVTKTTDGYNYISMNDDVYLYTGVTSVRSDDSNLGFYFVNLRTKDAKFYRVSSVSEKAAMQSAKGQIQEKGYTPTFPVLLNINDRPVYLVALKDNSNLAKLFALIDAEKYQNVYMGSSVEEALNNYNLKTVDNNAATDKSKEIEITVEAINSAVIDGNTIYFIKNVGDNTVYVGSAKQLGSKIVFVKVNDKIKIFGNPKEKQFDILEIR